MSRGAYIRKKAILKKGLEDGNMQTDMPTDMWTYMLTDIHIWTDMRTYMLTYTRTDMRTYMLTDMDSYAYIY